MKYHMTGILLTIDPSSRSAIKKNDALNSKLSFFMNRYQQKKRKLPYLSDDKYKKKRNKDPYMELDFTPRPPLFWSG